MEVPLLSRLIAVVLALAPAMGTARAAAITEVRATNGAVTINAQNVPLSQVLDRLSTATGMTLTYEGVRPSMPVSMAVDGISETEAVLKLMEGIGVSYVLSTDITGSRVKTLIVSGAGTGRPVPASAVSAASSEPAYEEPVADYGHIPLDPAALEAAGGPAKPDLNNPYLGLPAQHFPPGMPAPVQPDAAGATGSASQGTRGYPTGPIAPTGPMAPPAFPTGASYPAR